jgi:hypothetical protein
MADVLSGHVLFEVESADRMYLNVYQPKLQYGGGVSAFFAGHRGHKYASSEPLFPDRMAWWSSPPGTRACGPGRRCRR